ncbi:hypothetical protein RIF29_23028 [Crotalaria pallida]|uniref:Uncharacterized protein n=1 Tax=Crotalaria pallida TaxID=3830 RepID=A0AAN9IEV5_CROPI
MSTSIGMRVPFLLVLVLVCFNSSTSTLALFISISNDMPDDQPEVSFFYNTQQPEIFLEPGIPFTKTANFGEISCRMFWDVLCVNFDLYDPKRDGNNGKAYWSVRTDGLYQSYNNMNFQKRASWKAPLMCETAGPEILHLLHAQGRIRTPDLA